MQKRSETTKQACNKYNCSLLKRSFEIFYVSFCSFSFLRKSQRLESGNLGKTSDFIGSQKHIPSLCNCQESLKKATIKVRSLDFLLMKTLMVLKTILWLLDLRGVKQCNCRIRKTAVTDLQQQSTVCFFSLRQGRTWERQGRGQDLQFLAIWTCQAQTFGLTAKLCQ